MKKRKSYGTVMVDINTHRIVDMIESREYDAVSEWLKSYPNLEVVSRDGSITYKNAIESAHPKSKQISDRFHLLKNLTAYAIDYLKKELNAYVTIPLGEESTSTDSTILPKANENRKLTAEEKYDKIKALSQLGYTKTRICKEINMDLRFYEKLTAMTELERENVFKTKLNLTQDEKVELKMKAVNEVRNMKKAGLSNREIERRTRLNYRTVTKYLKENFNPVHAMRGVKKNGILIPYIKEIDSMLESGMMGTEITKKIQTMGYTGSSSNIRHYISDWKKRRKHIYDETSGRERNTEILERKEVFKLLFHPLEKVESINSNTFERLCCEYPCFQKVYALIWEFRQLLADKIPANLASWLKKAIELDIREITSFVEGVRRDFEAVYNAVKFDYSNGLAEGSINKLKLIKRIMYGRNSFSTFRTKVLIRENPAFFNQLC